MSDLLEQRIEAAAKALYERDVELKRPTELRWPWDDLSAFERDQWRSIGRRALLASDAVLAQAGMVVVPREATPYDGPVGEMRLNYEGALADLDSALDVLIARINGDRDMQSAAVWLRMNYPKKAAMLRAAPDNGGGERDG